MADDLGVGSPSLAPRLYRVGLALRFARIARIRDDKSPEDADTVGHLRSLFARQGAAGVKNAWEVLVSTGHLAMAHSIALLGRPSAAGDGEGDESLAP